MERNVMAENALAEIKRKIDHINDEVIETIFNAVSTGIERDLLIRFVGAIMLGLHEDAKKIENTMWDVDANVFGNLRHFANRMIGLTNLKAMVETVLTNDEQ